MIGNRDQKQGEQLPDVELEQINARRWQIRFNFSSVAATTGEQAMPAGFQYEYVNVDELSKKAIKKAIIRSKYDHDDEISLINDKDAKPDAYNAYQDLRSLADNVIAKVI